jgi:hypothetical protein
MNIRPFRDGDVHAAFRNLQEEIRKEIDSLENEYVLKVSQTELERHFIDKGLIHPLVLHTDEFYIESQSGTKLDMSHDFRRAVFPGERAIVQGTRIEIAIPFEGDDWLWRIQPSTHILRGFPEIDVLDDRIQMPFAFPDDSANPESLKRSTDSQVKDLATMVNYLAKDVENHNNMIRQIVPAAIQRKREKAKEATGSVAALGIPMKRRDQPATFAIPATRRPSPTRKPSAQVEPYQPEPVLESAEYQHILDVMRSMSLVIERNPSSFATLDEEAIRDHFLLQLNGHYEGGATGETFNASGKTDILIRAGDRNVFIAECKFWRGPQGFSEATDQLLRYLTWRDSKCALLVFNKTRDPVAVRTKMHEVISSRAEYRRTVKQRQDGDSQYILVKPSDPGREIILTTQLYDIPHKTEGGSH